MKFIIGVFLMFVGTLGAVYALQTYPHTDYGFALTFISGIAAIAGFVIFAAGEAE